MKISPASLAFAAAAAASRSSSASAELKNPPITSSVEKKRGLRQKKTKVGLKKPDYSWVAGNYTECIIDSSLDVGFQDDVNVAVAEEDYDCDGTLEIKSASGDPKGLTFEAIFTWEGKFRYIYHGVASYSHKYQDEITFHSDFIDIFNQTSGQFERFDNAEVSDAAYLRVTKESKNGDTIVVDLYDNEIWPSVPAPPSNSTDPDRKLFWSYFDSVGIDLSRRHHYVIQASLVFRDPMD